MVSYSVYASAACGEVGKKTVGGKREEKSTSGEVFEAGFEAHTVICLTDFFIETLRLLIDLFLLFHSGFALLRFLFYTDQIKDTYFRMNTHPLVVKWYATCAHRKRRKY